MRKAFIIKTAFDIAKANKNRNNRERLLNMNARELVVSTLNHQQNTRVPLDFGSTAVTGMHISCISDLRDYYGLPKRPVKMYEPYQNLGLIEEDLAQAIGIDVAGVTTRTTMFGFENKNWKEYRLDSGLEVLVAEDFVSVKVGFLTVSL